MEGEYRLSDITRCFRPQSYGKGWWTEAFWCAGMRTNVSIHRHWPSSIGEDYANRAAVACTHPSAELDPCIQNVLLEIVRQRAANGGVDTAASSHTRTANDLHRLPCRDVHHGPDECVVHLRLGEVFSQINLTAQELWRGQPGTGAPWDWDWGRKGKETRTYVKPIRYFEEVATQLPKGIRTIILLGKADSLTAAKRTFPHGDSNHAIKQSQVYLDLLRTFLLQKGFAVRMHRGTPGHTHHATDCDFVYMSTAACFVPSGGGFSALAASIVDKGGGHVRPHPARSGKKFKFYI